MAELKVNIPESFEYNNGALLVDAFLFRRDGSPAPRYYEDFCTPGMLEFVLNNGVSGLAWSSDVPEYGMSAGEPICIFVHNGDSNPARFLLEFAVPEEPIRAFDVAPPEALNWCWLGGKMRHEAYVDLEPYETRAIPLGISIPASARLPQHWQIELIVSRVTGEAGQFVWQSNVETVRLFITMMDLTSLSEERSILWAG